MTMKGLRYLAQSINLLNLLLAGLLAVLLAYGLLPVLSGKATRPDRQHGASPDRASAERAASPAPQAGDYMVVAEMNLFHPDRRVPPEKKEEKEIPKPELVLYGTVLSGEASYAYVEDAKSPYATPGRGKRPHVMKKGDVIGGFVLKEIEPTRIALVRNDETMTVMLNTEKARGSQAEMKSAAPPAARPFDKAVLSFSSRRPEVQPGPPPIVTNQKAPLSKK
jgi:hypothetical protein